MSLYGDDCYFYYYSNCTKGSTCPYRHVPEARGTEIMCSLWKAGHCSRAGCRYRHMEITVDRSNIPCYWESQPTGCTKPFCPFKHYKERTQEVPQEPVPERSVIPPMNKSINKTLDRSTPSPTSQLNRSSPKIEPVVVNPFSDDSDEGSPVKTPRKTQNTGTKITLRRNSNEETNADSGLRIKTLAEIKREKEMFKVINDSLDKPIDNESDIEPYKTLQRPTLSVRKIVLETATKPVSQNLPIENIEKKIVNKKSVSPNKGNIKSRLGRKIKPSDKEEENESEVKKISITSRLGTNITKENDHNISEVKVKSLEEIKMAKQKKQLKEDKTEKLQKKGIRRITIVDEDQSKTEVKPLSLTEIKKKRALAAVKANNDQESDSIQKTSVIEKHEKPVKRTLKQERALYVPPSVKRTDGNSLSPPKKIKLCRDNSEDNDHTTSQGKPKVHVKTFAELMAEKRKKKEEEEQLKEEREIVPKKPKSNFTPIVFDLDQKEKLAAPKVVAATLPFRHKKSALVAPLQSSKTGDSNKPKGKLSESEKAKDISKNVTVNTNTVIKSSESTSPKVLSTDKSNVENCITDSSLIKHLSGDIETNSVQKQIEIHVDKSEQFIEKSDSALQNPRETQKQISVESIQKVPASIKRKSTSTESVSEKKKSRTSFHLSEDDEDLLFDEDDNDFTLSSQPDCDEADILGDIDALLA